MAESGGDWIIDGEDIADVSPWEFDAVELGSDGNTISLTTDANSGNGDSTKGYKFYFAGNDDTCRGYKGVSGAPTEYYARFYIYFPLSTYPYSGEGSPTVWVLLHLYDLPGTSNVQVQLASYDSGIAFYRYYYGGGNFTAVTDAISTETWHWIEAYAKSADGTGAAKLWLDGDLIVDESSLSNDGYAVDRAYIGNVTSGTVPALDEYFYIDDFKASTTGPIGAYAPGTTTTTTTPAPTVAMPIISFDGVHSAVFGGQVITG